MKEYLQAIVAIIIAISTIYFICWVRREKFTFLNLSLNAKVINNLGELVLVSIVVGLKNMGKTRISARTRKNIVNKPAAFLYEEYGEWDRCKHAGTLKIRKVPDNLNVDLFDWYSLPQITNKLILKDGKQGESDFEQINYLEEYEDPYTKYRDVSFWI
jgi:hypothetical protein